MAEEKDSSEANDEFIYTVKYIRNGFCKLAERSKHDGELLYKSSHDYASKNDQDWTKELVEKSLLYLSKHLLNPHHTAKILYLFEQCILELVRLALASEADYQAKVLTLGIIVKHRPTLIQHFLYYFEDKNAPWEKDDVRSNNAKKLKLDGSDVPLGEIVEACWYLLKSNLDYFRDRWDWSSLFTKSFKSSDDVVRWYSIQCMSLVFDLAEQQKMNIFNESFPKLEYDTFDAQEEVSKQAFHALPAHSLQFDKRASRAFIPLYQPNAKLLTVNIAGVMLPVLNLSNQVKEGCLVETKSTLHNLRRVAVGISSGRAVCLVGAVGSGKTSLISHLALLTGRVMSKDVLKVQLGEETDSKLLLGTYQCTDVPGEFIWSPGMLTKAIVEGRWLLLEDIGSATSDVAALIANLLQQKSITIPGFKDNVRPAPGFHLFMTQRVVNNVAVSQRRDISCMELLEGHWLRVNLEPMSRDELVSVIQTKHPMLKTIATRMTSVYLLFSQGNHEEAESTLIQGGSRLISTRDLFKWCRRAEIEFDVSSVESALKVFQDAIDIFCCSYSSEERRLELACKVASCLGIINTKAEYFCKLHKPSISLTSTTCVAGRGVLSRADLNPASSLKMLSEGMKYALTQSACCLLERVAVCLSLDEPALLVGETGTGKTTTLQLLANQTGHKLVVINMNQQSDSADLLGGFKPIDTKQVILPIRDEFEEMFRAFFNVEKNLKFLENISVCISNRRWMTLLKLMITSQNAAVRRLIMNGGDKSLLKNWQKLGEKMKRLETQLKQNESAMAFSFVEGSLIKAMKQGHWVLLDEINLASAETLQCLSGLLEGSTLQLLERGDETSIEKHPDFRIMAAMNPATDFGKKDLPPGIRNRFTELYVSEHTLKNDLSILVSCYLPDQPSVRVDSIVEFYLLMRKYAAQILSDGSGNRPHFSLRTLCRALVIASENRCGTITRSLYEALCLSFLTQLDSKSHEIVKSKITAVVADKTSIKTILKQPIPEPTTKQHVEFVGYWVSRGPNLINIPTKYILTESVKRNLCDLARVVSLSNHPVLVQGETSVGKTSLIIYLAQASGHRVLRINNHQHTDLQEYVGSYCADPATGSLIFKEGVLAEAMRKGDWIILDELNLAPSEVLEALNRVLDDNRELFIPETSVTIKAHPDFRIFATQNPPGTYGGRKMLSRAFRNRFVELHFGEIPCTELEIILHKRCDMPLSYCKKLVAVMSDLQLRRRGSAAFAGKQGYITLRDLFRWGERYRLASRVSHLNYYDWDQHVADEGYLVLAGRVRKQEEQETIKDVIEKKFKRTINLDKLFTLNEETSLVTKHILEKTVSSPLPHEFRHLVWTLNLRKLAVLVGKALEFQEPILLVGETGCGKTTICQLLAALGGQVLYSVNCHQHSESSDFLGGLRPVREMAEKSGKLFEWVDGPLIEAMREGGMFLVDEISLADDSVLERLNSLLEPERKLLVSEKGSGDDVEIVAEERFCFIGTMNPGGDFGKKELSPALRNRLTEIWCEGPSSQEDLVSIVEHNVQPNISFGVQQGGKTGIGRAIIDFISWFSKTEVGKRTSISIRDLLVWVNFINKTASKMPIGLSYFHGGCLTFIDALGSANTSTDNISVVRSYKESCKEFLVKQIESAGELNEALNQDSSFNPDIKPVCCNQTHKFGFHPFYIDKAPVIVTGNDVSKEDSDDFVFDGPTTSLNTLRLLRGMVVGSRAVLLEGSPGVGKTSLVLALAKATGHQVCRINLSEQTDISDLFGSDLPVEGAEGGTFAWSDGPFLRALKKGHWILLDELNLASQSVVEGLNSVLDHRGEIYIPELGRSFKVNADETKLFACQNPQRQGGARKGLPQSFLNRFTQVFFEPLSESDLEVLLKGRFPGISSEIISKMVSFHNQVCSAKLESPGVWEFNLRDLIRWASTVEAYTPGVAVESIYAARMPKPSDRNLILNIYREVFGEEFPLGSSLSPILVTPSAFRIGEIVVARDIQQDPYSAYNGKEPLLILREQQPALKSLALCINSGWMSILVGKSGCGKSSLVETLAQMKGAKLNTIPVSPAMDTTDLLGGFEQSDPWRKLDEIVKSVKSLTFQELRRALGDSDKLQQKLKSVCDLYSRWQHYIQCSRRLTHSGYNMKESWDKLKEQMGMLQEVLEMLPKERTQAEILRLKALEADISKTGLKSAGVFEWVDSVFIRCVEEGEWLLLDNVNLCSGAVLDRLNSLLENYGKMSLAERGGEERIIVPSPGFSLFLTMDPKHGQISRAMRNRGVEIYLDIPEVRDMNPIDLDSLLYNRGMKFSNHRSSLIDIHNRIVELSMEGEKPGLAHLLQVAYISSQSWAQGFPLFESVEQAATDVYIKSMSFSHNQRNLLSNALQETLKPHKETLSSCKLETRDFFWAEYKTMTTLSLQEDCLLTVAKQHSAVLYSIMRNFERVGVAENWPKEFTLSDIVGPLSEKLRLKHFDPAYNVLDLFPYLIICYYCCATYRDTEARSMWVEEIMKQISEGRSSKVFHKIESIFNMLSRCVNFHLMDYESRVWDLRHMQCTRIADCPGKSNRLMALLYYKLIADVHHQYVLDPDKSWTLMSVIEYSQAVHQGDIPEVQFHGLIFHLNEFVDVFDKLVLGALKKEETMLSDEYCAELIYKLSWRFKLTTVGRRRLFVVSSSNRPPQVCPQTLAIIELHYSWLRKYSIPLLINLVDKIHSLKESKESLEQLMILIDSSLDGNMFNIVPIARKFKKLLKLPLPKSSVTQFDTTKKINSAVSDIDIWRNSSKRIAKINFLASLAGEETRSKILQAATLVSEGKELDILSPILDDVECRVKRVTSEEGVEYGLTELMSIKTWPLVELIGLKLNTAVRRITMSDALSRTDEMLVEGLSSWLESSPSVDPVIASTVRSILHHHPPPHSSIDILLHQALLDHLNLSPALKYPLNLLDWEGTANLNNDYDTFFEYEDVFLSHMPLLSLFLSKILTGISSQHDTPTFALKAHKNMNRMFQMIKLLLWRNLPVIYSKMLSNRENEIYVIDKMFEHLYKNLKYAINAKYEGSITSDDPFEIVSEAAKFFPSVRENRSGSGWSGGSSIASSMLELSNITSELHDPDNDSNNWLLIGEAFAHLGRILLFLFAALDPVDPIQKKVIKLQYFSEEAVELRKLLCSEELTKAVIGAPLSWPLKVQHEQRIAELEKKAGAAGDSFTAVRPAASLYSNILQDVNLLTMTLVSSDVFESRMARLMSLAKSSVPSDEKGSVLWETNNWLRSLQGVSEKLQSKYFVGYPDIISPILLALSQIIYGVKIVLTTAEKEYSQNCYRGNIRIDRYLEMLSTFPVSDLNGSLEMLDALSSAQIVSFLEKCNEESKETHHPPDNKIKLVKICIRIVKSQSRTCAMERASNTFFQVLDHVVLCWHQIQEAEKVKKAQEDSIYINRMKLTEEELLEREKQELFPSSRDKDFGDLEAPESLEGRVEVGEDKERKKEPLKLSGEEIAEICSLHSEIVREAAKAHWLGENSQPEHSPLLELKERIGVFSILIDEYYKQTDESLDAQSVLPLLLASSLPSLPTSTTDQQKHYDFYRDPNIAESKLCIPLLNAIHKRCKELLLEWPDHPTLNQIVEIIDRVTGFSMGSPLSRFLTGLELLLSKLHHWEEHAHAGVSLAQHSAALVQQIISWRKLELSAWKGALQSTFSKVEGEGRKWWFHIYALVTSFIRNTSAEPLEDEREELVKSLQSLMETSSLGEYSIRLELLFTFHCHVLILPSSHRQGIVSRILWNIYSFYKLFCNSVSKVISELTAPIEKKIKEFVKIARWNDINYWSVKSAIDKTHHTLLKHINEYKKILSEPARGAMVKVDISKGLSSKMNLSSLSASAFLITTDVPVEYADIEILSCQLDVLLKKSKSLTGKTIKHCSYPKLLDNLELLIEEVEETGNLLNEFDIDESIPKEKRKSIVKSLLQRKRKAISDLFKILSQIGLSYRSGLLMFEQKNIAFTKLPPVDVNTALDVIDPRKSDGAWLNCWKGTEYYFYTSIAKTAVLKIALEKPHKDLGPQFIERIKGFTAHANNLLIDLKDVFTKFTLSLYTIRCQQSQFLRMAKDDYGIIESDFMKNQESLKRVYEDIIHCLKQFLYVFDICPEEETSLTDKQLVPLIFSDSTKYGMVNALKHDPVWESTKAKVESALNSAQAISKQISTVSKNRNFVSSLQTPVTDVPNVDIITNAKDFNLIEDGYDQLRKIYEKIVDIESVFDQNVLGEVLPNPLTSCLGKLRKQIDNTLQSHIDLKYPSKPKLSDFNKIVSAIPGNVMETLEGFLNKILCIIQNIYKSHSENNEGSVTREGGTVSEETSEEQSDIILEGHLKEKLIERLLSDLNTLRISEISQDLQTISKILLDMDNCLAREACQGFMYHICPVLDQLISLYHYFVVHVTSSVKILGKLSTSLSSVFTEFSKNGYKIPEELIEEAEGEGESQKGGLGLGEGEGEKDVSDQIESEDQLDDARKPGDYGKDEDKDCKEEEKGVEMSENFDGKLQDLEKKEGDEERSDEEDEKDEDMEKEMGDTEKGADTLDKQIWGSDSEEEEEEEKEMPKDEKGNKGEQQSEKELGAKEDEDKTEVSDKDDVKRKEPKEKEINEMNEPEIDDDHIDPYHGKQQPSPEVEPLDLQEEEMELDEDDDKASDKEDEENPFDIDTMKKKIEDNKEGEENKDEEAETEEKDDKTDNKDDDESDEESTPDVKKPEEEVGDDKDEEENIEEETNDEEGRGGKIEEELEEKVGEEEAGGADEEPSSEVTESSEKQKGSTDQVKSHEEMDADNSLNPEETQAEGKEESGSGKAEQMDTDSGGHRGESGKRKQRGDREQQKQKSKPGQSDIERSLGEVNEPVKKKLKTMGIQKEDLEEEEEGEGDNEKLEDDAEADLYQHIHEAKKNQYDAQTIDSATQEQVEKQAPTINKEDEEGEKMEEDDEMNLVEEDELMPEVCKGKEEESKKLDEAKKKEDSKKNKGEGGGPLEEATVEVEGEYVETARVDRGGESTFHTRLDQTSVEPITQEELIALRAQLQAQLATWTQRPSEEEAQDAWEKVCNATRSLSQQLSEELRLLLEPTTASNLRGDFRTGKRINMRKVIPYIASQFRKDKIWLRRTKPSKRDYQIILAIDDSSSMADNKAKELAFESLAVVSKALNLIEAGELAVISFGEEVRVLHQLGQPFTEASGARLIQEFSFGEKHTRVGAAVETALGMVSMRGADSAQLLVIVSDGRGVMSEGEEAVRAAVRKANHARLFIVFIIIDSPTSKDSILDIRLPVFKGGKLLEIKSYMDSFPFPFYMILRDIANLPSVLSDALRQWFQLVTDLQ